MLKFRSFVILSPPFEANLYTQVYNILIVNKIYCFVNINI